MHYQNYALGLQCVLQILTSCELYYRVVTTIIVHQFLLKNDIIITLVFGISLTVPLVPVQTVSDLSFEGTPVSPSTCAHACMTEMQLFPTTTCFACLY